MKKLGPYPQRILKSIHLIFACLWVGGAIALASKQFFVNPRSDGELQGILATMKFVDDFIIIPGAIGCLLTGMFYSVLTSWGWFRHRWITVKWCICLYGVIFGTYPLGPWLNELAALSWEKGLGLMHTQVYQKNVLMLQIFGSFQTATLILACVISSLKPWKKAARSRSKTQGAIEPDSE